VCECIMLTSVKIAKSDRILFVLVSLLPSFELGSVILKSETTKDQVFGCHKRPEQGGVLVQVPPLARVKIRQKRPKNVQIT
jgi:hypothetical protein